MQLPCIVVTITLLFRLLIASIMLQGALSKPATCSILSNCAPVLTQLHKIVCQEHHVELCICIMVTPGTIHIVVSTLYLPSSTACHKPMYLCQHHQDLEAKMLAAAFGFLFDGFAEPFWALHIDALNTSLAIALVFSSSSNEDNTKVAVYWIWIILYFSTLSERERILLVCLTCTWLHSFFFSVTTEL